MINFYIKEEELGVNGNASFGLPLELQNHLACQNVQFVVELARELKTSYSIPTLALHIATIFFHKKSYLHFDRFVVLTACYLLASKIKNMDCRVKNLCTALHSVVSRKAMSVEPFNEDKMKKLKEQISIHETEVLRTLEYDIDTVTPHDFLKRDCELLFPGERDTNKRILLTTRILILDSYRTQACLLYPPLTIFTACFLIANRYEGRKPYDGPVTRSASSSPNPGEEELYRTWLEALSSREGQQLSETAVRDCLRMINSILPSAF